MLMKITETDNTEAFYEIENFSYERWEDEKMDYIHVLVKDGDDYEITDAEFLVSIFNDEEGKVTENRSYAFKTVEILTNTLTIIKTITYKKFGDESPEHHEGLISYCF